MYVEIDSFVFNFGFIPFFKFSDDENLSCRKRVIIKHKKMRKLDPLRFVCKKKLRKRH